MGCVWCKYFKADFTLDCGHCGHVARMPVTRAPRQLLTGWVAHSRPNGCPEMTWGRTLKKALKCKGLPAKFKEWRAIAEDRSEWRSRTYSKPIPPSEN